MTYHGLSCCLLPTGRHLGYPHRANAPSQAPILTYKFQWTSPISLMSLHTLICLFLWTSDISECHTTLSWPSSTGSTVVSRCVPSHTRSTRTKFLRYITLSTRTTKGAVTIHISLIKNQKLKTKTNKQKTHKYRKSLCLRSLCFRTQNLNLTNMTPKSVLAYDCLGEILGNRDPTGEPAFPCLIHPSILSCICLLSLSLCPSFFF